MSHASSEYKDDAYIQHTYIENGENYSVLFVRAIDTMEVYDQKQYFIIKMVFIMEPKSFFQIQTKLLNFKKFVLALTSESNRQSV